MTAKEYLEQVKDKEIQVKNVQKKLERLREISVSIGAVQYDTTKVQTTHTVDKIGDLYAKIDEQQQLLNDMIFDFVEFKMQLVEEIYQLNDDRYIEVLCRRYIYLHSWKKIIDDLNYNGRYVFHIHGAALNEFYQMYKNKLDQVA